MLGSLRIGWDSLVTVLGALLSLLMTVSLYRPRHKRITGALALHLFGFLIGGFLARFLHWYFNSETYSGFLEAFSDFSVGSYVLPGLIVGTGLAAWLVYRMGMAPSVWELLDCSAPGMLLLISFLRLSAAWNDSCRGLMQVTQSRFQHLPFAVLETDAAGNQRWVLATFLIAFNLIFFLSLFVYICCRRPINQKIRIGRGEVARWSLLLYCAVEIVTDSTRYDSPLMHFRFLTDLNQYSAFISIAQVFAGLCALAVLIFYSRKSIRSRGFSKAHAVFWVLFAISLFGIGKLGEYDVQRYASYSRSYTLMILSVVLMLGSIYGVFRLCPQDE